MATLRPRDGASQHLFPYSIVWTPIPIITWLLPFVGHMGICSSDGTIHDFAGPYFISVGNLAFGSPTRCALRRCSEPCTVGHSAAAAWRQS
jgi:hypothetical protein